MKVERLYETELMAAEEVAINTLLVDAFPGGFDDRSFYQQRHHLRYLVREEGRVIGHMALCFRAIRIADQLTTVYGLAEVATATDRRGEGIAGTLLDAVIADARRSNAAFLLLFGDRPIYAGRGFRKADNPITFVDLNDARTGEVKTVDRSDLMVMQLQDQDWDDAQPVDLLGHMF